jgi:hypothetical protein
MATPRPQQQSDVTLELRSGTQPPLDDLAREMGGTPLDQLDALAEEMGAQSQEAPGWLELAGQVVRGVADGLNPYPLLKALYDAQGGAYKRAHEAWGQGVGAGLRANLDAATLAPRAMVGGLAMNQWEQFDKARQAYREGRYTESAGHTAAGLLPLIGPAAATAGEEIGEAYADPRKAAHGVGGALSLAVPAALGKALGKGRGLPVTPALKGPKNPAHASAVAYAQQRGIPISAGVATENRAVQMIEAGSDHTLPGSFVAEDAAAKTADAMRGEAGALAGRANPGARQAGAPPGAPPPAGPPVTPDEAGRGVDKALQAREARMSGIQSQAYDRLRAIEADPAHTQTVPVGRTVDPKTGQVVPIMEDVPFPADLRNAQRAIRPALRELLREMTVAQQQASPGLKVLQELAREKWHVAASTLDKDLSALKALLRKNTTSPKAKFYLGKVVDELELALKDAIDNLPPAAAAEARAELLRGRTATRAKYDTKDVRREMFGKQGDRSPVLAFRDLIAAGDKNIDDLLKVQRLTPKQLPKIARALLESLFDHSMKEGGWTRTDLPWTRWNAIGPRTKAILFKPAHIRDLNDFFTLSKRVGKDANPSGSGKLVVAVRALETSTILLLRDPIVGVTYAVAPYLTSKLLHSPGGVAALKRGLRIPISNKLAATATVSQIAKFAGDGLEVIEEDKEKTR